MLKKKAGVMEYKQNKRWLIQLSLQFFELKVGVLGKGQLCLPTIKPSQKPQCVLTLPKIIPGGKAIGTVQLYSLWGCFIGCGKHPGTSCPEPLDLPTLRWRTIKRFLALEACFEKFCSQLFCQLARQRCLLLKIEAGGGGSKAGGRKGLKEMSLLMQTQEKRKKEEKEGSEEEREERNFSFFFIVSFLCQ